jgi:signal transduction histidine kinase
MTELVEEILTLTQLDADGLGTRSVTVDARRAIREAAASVADPRHLTQILMNLLSNALKYGVPPVEVTVDGRNPVAIDVRDHGDGVPADFVPRLFDRFTRADTPASRARKGTGLGLYIVRQLVETNGGAVEYRDHPGDGGCFTVRLPAAPPPA